MPQLSPGLKNLLIIMCLMGLAQIALPKIGFDTNQFCVYYFDSPNFKLYQLLTHIFCHVGIEHFLFNGLALYSFGAVVEARLGTSRFMLLFFISAFGAILLHFSETAWIINDQFETIIPNIESGIEKIPYSPMLGASGAVYGVMVAFAVLYPNESMIFLFIPYPIKAKYLVPVIVGLDVFLGIGNFSEDNIAHFAHIGGALAGFLYCFILEAKNLVHGK